MEKTDIIVIGGGAAGLMAAWAAASERQCDVLVLEKMPRPGRKIMITGKGRCNYSNMKPWNDFCQHIRSKQNFLRPAFYNLTPEAMTAFLNDEGLETTVQRGDRAYPASLRAADVVDTLVEACREAGARIETDAEVRLIEPTEEGFRLSTVDGFEYSCRKLIVATGGLSYPRTGSTGDGYKFAKEFGHSIKPLFPSLTALVPRNYKRTDAPRGETTGRIAARVLSGGAAEQVTKLLPDGYPETKGHIDWTLPLTDLGKDLCGLHLRNTGVTLTVGSDVVREEFGEIEFTDGGIEGPISFAISRDAVKAISNGSKVAVTLNLKENVPAGELRETIDRQLDAILRDPRSDGRKMTHILLVLLRKLLPREAIAGFQRMHPGLLKDGKIDTKALQEALQAWKFEIAGFVGYERSVVTAGGVSTDEISPKTMESRLHGGLYFAGEVLDIDSDTGGYNLQSAFSTGALAGRSAALAL